MRLLETTSIRLHEFQGDSIPDYAILSHTWGAEEISYQLLSQPEARSLNGYGKLTGCCKLAAAQGWKYVWIDTCCIDKTSSAELSEAINSVWRWYSNSAVCYAYLSDYVKPTGDDSSDAVIAQSPIGFKKARWWSRGWTLQELLAPSKVVFYDALWIEIGDKNALSSDIQSISGIPYQHLRQPKIASVAAKMSWMSKRTTTRSEDIAYSLLGLFEVYMPLIYGEGSNAFLRLQQEIVKSSDDETIFAWTDDSLIESGMFALSPTSFADSGKVVKFEHPAIRRSPYSVTNFGLAIEVVTKMGHDGPVVDTNMKRPYPFRLPIACARIGTRQPLTISILSVARHTVRVDTGKLIALEGALVFPKLFRTIYVKSTYRYRPKDWEESPLEMRWNATFAEYLTCYDRLSSDLVSERKLQHGRIYSDYAGKTIALLFLDSQEAYQVAKFQGEHMLRKRVFPKLILQWRLVPGAASVSITVYVTTAALCDLRSLEQVNDCYNQHYDLRTGQVAIIPLWKDLQLQADVRREGSGERCFFINLDLRVSKRRFLPRLK
ncbi:MAG: hypothetical protein LQ346_004013 [Caloplaca aetnensis]|nr:MAG: hypothetical protein LQ346_004013 [Caloplaca aetnensis]